MITTLIAATAAAAGAAEPVETRLYAANLDGSVSVFSTDDHKLLTRIELGGMIDDVVGSPDGRTVYVNIWLQQPEAYLPDRGELVALDTKDHEILWRMPLDDGWPHHVVLSPDGRYLYSPVFDRAHVNVIDLETQTVADRFEGVLGMHGLKISDDGERLYAGAMTMESMVIFDTDSGDVLKSIDFPHGVRPFDTTRDERTMLAQQSRYHGFAIADLDAGVVTEMISFGEPAEGTEIPQSWPHTYNHGLAITHDDRFVLAAGSMEDFVAIAPLGDYRRFDRVPICDDPNWIVINEASTLGYVSCRGSGEVSVIDIGERREMLRMDAKAEGTVRLRLVDVPVE